MVFHKVSLELLEFLLEGYWVGNNVQDQRAPRNGLPTHFNDKRLLPSRSGCEGQLDTVEGNCKSRVTVEILSTHISLNEQSTRETTVEVLIKQVQVASIGLGDLPLVSVHWMKSAVGWVWTSTLNSNRPHDV